APAIIEIRSGTAGTAPFATRFSISSFRLFVFNLPRADSIILSILQGSVAAVSSFVVTASQRLCMTILYERCYRGCSLSAQAGKGAGTFATRAQPGSDLAQRRTGHGSGAYGHALARRHTYRSFGME